MLVQAPRCLLGLNLTRQWLTTSLCTESSSAQALASTCACSYIHQPARTVNPNMHTHPLRKRMHPKNGMSCPSIAERRKHCTFITHPCNPNMQKHPCMHVTWLDMPKPTSCPCMVSTQIERRGGSSAKNQASLPQHENYVARLSLQKKGKTSRTCTSYCIPLVPTQQKYQ